MSGKTGVGLGILTRLLAHGAHSPGEHGVDRLRIVQEIDSEAVTYHTG
jgi:hypothetical protein